MEWYLILSLVGTGIAAGFINTTAGGGSMLTIPLLMFLGLPANVANGTNRIAILLQNVIGVQTFRKKQVLDLKTDYKLAIPAIIGSSIGALFAVEIDPVLLKKIIAGLMIVMFFIVVLKPEVCVREHAGSTMAKPTILQYIHHGLWHFTLHRSAICATFLSTFCVSTADLNRRRPAGSREQPMHLNPGIGSNLRRGALLWLARLFCIRDILLRKCKSKTQHDRQQSCPTHKYSLWTDVLKHIACPDGPENQGQTARGLIDAQQLTPRPIVAKSGQQGLETRLADAPAKGKRNQQQSEYNRA